MGSADYVEDSSRNWTSCARRADQRRSAGGRPAVIRPGVSTADLNAAAEEVLKKYGVYSPFKNYPGPYPYPASTCVSVNEELVHGIPDPKRKLKEGDIVTWTAARCLKVLWPIRLSPPGWVRSPPRSSNLLEVTESSLYAGHRQNGRWKSGW